MDLVIELKNNIKNALHKLGIEVELSDVFVEKSRDASHGDYASNVCLKYAKKNGKNPVEFANLLIDNLDKSYIDHVEIAGPGFMNFFLKDDSLQNVISLILNQKDDYGRGEYKNKTVNVEFVSANPTGDLHVGTARGAAIGDSLARILAFSGYDVIKEYYINDAGKQIENLALSIQARYFELLGKPFTLPEDGYHGQDVIDIAKEVLDEYGEGPLSYDDPIAFFKEIGIDKEMKKIKRDLSSFGVEFDVFTSEKEIRKNNAVENELKYLEKYTYEQDGALLLKTTEFLDDKDRVIVKSDGDYTYFLPDIVYHLNKLSRKADCLIDVLGADHHGYINRMKSALMMHGYKEDVLSVELIQMVRFIKDGVEKKASKRAGDAYKIRELVEEVGVDAARYFFAMRMPSTHLDFDLSLAVEQSSSNPVFYSQYAYARMCSVLKMGEDIAIDETGQYLSLEKEKLILKTLADFPKVVESAAKDLLPNKITNYVHELAESVHSWYNDTKIVDRSSIEVSASRLALCEAIKQVVKNALFLVGVNTPEHM